MDSLRRHRCGVIVGDHGTGKSTLLRELAATLADEMPGGQWVQLTLPEGGSRWHLRETVDNVATVRRLARQTEPGGVLVVDGGEQLPAVYRMWLSIQIKRRGRFCLMTSHASVAGFKTLYQTSLSAELIEELVSELLAHDYPVKAPEHERNVSTEVRRYLEGVDLSDVSNLRDLWDDLYEVVERVTEQ